MIFFHIILHPEGLIYDLQLYKTFYLDLKTTLPPRIIQRSRVTTGVCDFNLLCKLNDYSESSFPTLSFVVCLV